MSNDIEHTVLLCGRCVPTSLYKSVRGRVEKRYSELQFNKPYKLEKICGETYWSGLRNYKNVAGWIMADLVDRQLVPYFFISERDAKPLWYSVKP